jgi:predicted alpha/beta hydrolase family esterase
LWPAKAKPLKPVPADTKGLPPIVVISTTNDPATPYQNGVDVAEQIPGAVLVTNEGDGHTIVGQGKPCIDDLARDYFIDLTVPKDGTTCK